MNDVYLHVGPMKTGSTFLQAVMWKNREKLREQGMLLPADHDNEHFLAANDVQGYRFAAIEYPEARGAWDKVAARARSWTGPALISCEILGISEPQHIARIAESLAPSTLHVVVLARCLADLLPSAYQEKVKQVNAHESWQDFLAHARPGGDDHWVQDIGGIVERWLHHVDPDRIHVITVPRPGTSKDVLLERFTHVLEVDPADFNVDGVGPNTSLDAIDVQLLQTILARTASTHSLRQRRHLVGHHLVPALRQVNRPRHPLRIPEALRTVVLDDSQRQVQRIRATHCQVHGDLDELTPRDSFSDETCTPDVRVEDLLATALDAWVTSLPPEP